MSAGMGKSFALAFILLGLSPLAASAPPQTCPSIGAATPSDAGESPETRASFPSSRLTAGAQRQPLQRFLGADGTLRLPAEGVLGSIDPTGCRLASGPGEVPRFAPVEPDGVTAGADGNWSPVFTPRGTSGGVLALAWDGTSLYAGGGFLAEGGTPANYVARWDGTSWSALGSGMNFVVYALAWDGTPGAPSRRRAASRRATLHGGSPFARAPDCRRPLNSPQKPVSPLTVSAHPGEGSPQNPHTFAHPLCIRRPHASLRTSPYPHASHRPDDDDGSTPTLHLPARQVDLISSLS